MLPIRRFLGSDPIRRGNSAAPHTGFGQFSFCSHLHGFQVCDDPDQACLFHFGIGGLVFDPDGPADGVPSSVDVPSLQLDRDGFVLRVTLEHEAIRPTNLPGTTQVLGRTFHLLKRLGDRARQVLSPNDSLICHMFSSARLASRIHYCPDFFQSYIRL